MTTQYKLLMLDKKTNEPTFETSLSLDYLKSKSLSSANSFIFADYRDAAILVKWANNNKWKRI